MEFAPEISITTIQIGGVNEYPVRTFWKPTCLRCKWSDEPHPTKESAEFQSVDHLKFRCLANAEV